MTIGRKQNDSADILFVDERKYFLAFFGYSPPRILAPFVCCFRPQGSRGDHFEGGLGVAQLFLEPLLLDGAEHGALFEVAIITSVGHEEVDVADGEVEPAARLLLATPEIGVWPVFFKYLPDRQFPRRLEGFDPP